MEIDCFPNISRDLKLEALKEKTMINLYGFVVMNIIMTKINYALPLIEEVSDVFSIKFYEYHYHASNPLAILGIIA